MLTDEDSDGSLGDEISLSSEFKVIGGGSPPGSPKRSKHKPAAKKAKPKDGAKKVDTPAGGAKKGEGSKPLAELLADAEKQNRSLAKQLDAAQRVLHERDRTLAERQKRWDLLEQQLADEQEKRRQLTRSNAARLLHVAKLERELEAQKQLQQATQQELEKQRHMMQIVLSFRDKQLTAEMAELVHDNIDLADRADKWRGRAKQLEHERWGFVQKFRTEQAKASRVVDKGKAASDDEGGEEDDDDDEEEEPEEGPEEEEEPEEEEADEGPGGGAAEGQRVLARSVTRNLTTQRTDSGLLLKGTR